MVVKETSEREREGEESVVDRRMAARRSCAAEAEEMARSSRMSPPGSSIERSHRPLKKWRKPSSLFEIGVVLRIVGDVQRTVACNCAAVLPSNHDFLQYLNLPQPPFSLPFLLTQRLLGITITSALQRTTWVRQNQNDMLIRNLRNT